MKIALYIEDGLEQIVFTPQSKVERDILAKLHDGSRSFELKHGSFFECRGGWMRHSPSYWTSAMYSPPERASDESTMIVLRAAQWDGSPQGGDANAAPSRSDDSPVPPQAGCAPEPRP